MHKRAGMRVRHAPVGDVEGVQGGVQQLPQSGVPVRLVIQKRPPGHR